MESKKGIKIAQLEEMNAQAGFLIGAYKMARFNLSGQVLQVISRFD